MNMVLKRFAEKVMSLNEIQGLLGEVERTSWGGITKKWTYRVCDGRNHFLVTFPIDVSPRESWPSCKGYAECDDSCRYGSTAFGEDIPWHVEKELGITARVPDGCLLVHQRFGDDETPYYKIFEPGDTVNPSQFKLGALLESGGSTIVMTSKRRRGVRHGPVNVLRVRNEEGKPIVAFITKIDKPVCVT